MILTSTAQTALNQSTKDNPVIGWQSIVPPANVAASSAAVGFPASNVANRTTRPPWKGLQTFTSETLTLTLPIGAAVDYVAIAGHNFFSAGIVPSLQTCTNIGAGNWITQAFPAFTIKDNGPIIFRIVKSTAYQGVRIVMTVALSVPPIIGTVYVGELLVFERSIKMEPDHTPINFAKQSKIVSGMSESGNFLGRIVQTQWSESQIDFEWLTSTFFRTSVKPFLDVADEFPFFVSWWPTRYPDDVGFVWLTDDSRGPVDPTTDRFSLLLKYQGLST